MPREDIHEQAQGRWAGILGSLGMPKKQLSGDHCECPICRNGTKSDSFRFDDKERRGTWICTHCGAGNGVDLVMKWKKLNFRDACEEIRKYVGTAAFNAPKADRVDEGELKREMANLWSAAQPLDGTDLASRYLRAREPALRRMPQGLRFVPELAYFDKGSNTKRLLPGMIGKFIAPDQRSATLHRTWLREPGLKADVEKPRRMYLGGVPDGGAIRLWPLEEELGVAEGIETAISASVRYDVPVWATTGYVEMTKFVPPPGVKRLIIFADSDATFTGQWAAYTLARILRTRKPEERIEVQVQLTRFCDTGEKEDFNDEAVRLAA